MIRRNGHSEFPITQRVGGYVKRANSEVAEIDAGVRRLVDRRPFAALIGAMAAGFVLARCAARLQ